MRGDTAYSDTVVGQHVLIGTTALPGTDQNMEARWVHGVSLNRVSFSPCSSGETEDMGSTLIEELIWTDSTLTVKAKVIANCGFSFLCDIEVLNDTPADDYPSAPPTAKEVVWDIRRFGRRCRTGRYSTTFSTTGASTAESALSALASESGWPTLQLSR